MNLNREALIAIRERSGLNVSALAERAGVDRTLIHRIENGQRNATVPVIHKLAVGLAVPITALLGPERDKVAA